MTKENLELKDSDLPPNVELVGDEEIPCCVIDIMTSEKLIPILTDLVEEKEEENKNLRLELSKVKNSLKNSDIPKECDPRTMLEKTDRPIEKLYDSDFDLYQCPTCMEYVKEDAIICPVCSQEFVKKDILKRKIKDIRSELLKHGELYDGFNASIEAAVKEFAKKHKDTSFPPRLLAIYILNYLIGEEK